MVLPKLLVAPDVNTLCHRRYAHNINFDEGDGNPGMLTPIPILETVSSLDEKQIFWKCPLCEEGVSLWTRSRVTLKAICNARSAHRSQRHPKVSLKSWRKRVSNRLHKHAEVQASRVEVLNRVAAERVKENTEFDTSKFEPFMWPPMTARKLRKGAKTQRKTVKCAMHFDVGSVSDVSFTTSVPWSTFIHNAPNAMCFVEKTPEHVVPCSAFSTRPLLTYRMAFQFRTCILGAKWNDHFHVYYEFRAWWCGKNPGRNHQPAGFTFGSSSFSKNSI